MEELYKLLIDPNNFILEDLIVYKQNKDKDKPPEIDQEKSIIAKTRYNGLLTSVSQKNT